MKCSSVGKNSSTLEGIFVLTIDGKNQCLDGWRDILEIHSDDFIVTTFWKAQKKCEWFWRVVFSSVLTFPIFAVSWMNDAAIVRAQLVVEDRIEHIRIDIDQHTARVQVNRVFACAPPRKEKKKTSK